LTGKRLVKGLVLAGERCSKSGAPGGTSESSSIGSDQSKRSGNLKILEVIRLGALSRLNGRGRVTRLN